MRTERLNVDQSEVIVKTIVRYLEKQRVGGENCIYIENLIAQFPIEAKKAEAINQEVGKVKFPPDQMTTDLSLEQSAAIEKAIDGYYAMRKGDFINFCGMENFIWEFPLEAKKVSAK